MQSPGGFTIDRTGRCTVLQGFGWLPKGELAEEMSPCAGEGVGELTAAYLAVLNSRAFFDEVARAEVLDGYDVAEQCAVGRHAGQPDDVGVVVFTVV